MPSFPKRKPTEAAVLGMLPLTDFLLPISYGFIIDTPFGTTRQSITVNAPQFIGNEEAARRYGRLLWQGVTAPAVTNSVILRMMTVTYWNALSLSVPQPVDETRGERMAFGTGRDNAAQLLMLTGHPDDDGKRRLFLPSVPRDWVANGLLTPRGWEELMAHARSLIMAFGFGSETATVNWLIPYPGALEPTVANPVGVAFRHVKHVRVCYHTDRAPDVTGLGSL